MVGIQETTYLDFNGEVVDRAKSDAGERSVYLTAKAKKIIQAAKERQRFEN